MNNKLIPLIMTLIVGIVLCGSLLAPAVNDAVSDNTLTKTNAGIPVTPIETWEAEFLMANGSATASVNDAAVTVTETAPMFISNNVTIIFNEAALIVYYWDSTNDLGKNISAPASVNVTVSDGTSTIVIVKGDVTTTLTYTDDWVYGYDVNGESISKYIPSTDTTLYYNNVNQLKGAFQTVGSSPTAFYSFVGDKVTVNGDEEVTATIESADTTSKEVKSSTFNRNTSTCDYTFAWNSATEYPLVVVAPHTVTGVIDNGIGAGGLALLVAIPILVIVGLLMMVVRNGLD